MNQGKSRQTVFHEKTITMFFYKIADKFQLKHSGSASRMIHDAKQ